MELIEHLRTKYGTNLRNRIVQENEAKQQQAKKDAIAAQEKAKLNQKLEFEYLSETSSEHLIDSVLKDIQNKGAAKFNKTGYVAKFTPGEETLYPDYGERYTVPTCTVTLGNFEQSFYDLKRNEKYKDLYLDVSSCKTNRWNKFDFKTGDVVVRYLREQGFNVIEHDTFYNVTL